MAHAVCLLVLPLVRNLIDGPTPLHLMEKPKAGTGAGLLIEMIAYVVTGRPIPTMTEARSDDEWRYRITSKLREVEPFLLIDNLHQPLKSPHLAAAITSTVWEDRKIGSSETVRLPVRCAWVATANNPVLSDEIQRRTVRIRLDAGVEKPWERKGFKHSDLKTWARENRAELVGAVLTLAQGWIVAGQPPGKQRLGSFESWAAVIGGILQVAEIPGFLENRQNLYATADPEDLTWRQFFAEWWGEHGNTKVKVADVFPLAQKCPLDLGKGDEHRQKISLGKKLSAKRDQRFEIESGGAKLAVFLRNSGVEHNTQIWRLEEVQPSS